MWQALFNILVFPGLLFLFVFSLVAEFVDRKLCARYQNRVGPPFFQPLADFIKLLGKAEVMTEGADLGIFRLMPVFALAAAATAIFYIPIWSKEALFSFNGDLIVVLYLLTLPSLCFFLGGWYSRSVYSMVGAVRALTQIFAYEVPLFLAILGPALLANTWSVTGITIFYETHPWFWAFNIIGFLVSFVALLGKLEKVPFDIPEAETELVAGPFTEYSGRLLALLRLSFNMEMVVAASLLIAVYLPWGLQLGPAAAFIIYLLKVFLIVAFISLARSLFARLRIDQMLELCWKYVAPFAFLQVLIDLVAKGVLLR